MAEQCFLAVDLGAESGRVMAGLFNGQTVRLEELHRFPNGAVSFGGTLRWDVLRLWQEIQTGLGKAAARFGQSIISVGVDTWGVDYVLLSRTGELLGQPYCYRDSRTRGVMEAAFQRVSREEIFASTGLQFMGINTLYQLLAMQQTSPELMAQADLFLMMPDLLNWLLCGSRVVEFTNATTTQCFDPHQRTWAYDMLRKLGLPTQMFPEVVAPGTTLGRLREDVAERTGLGRIQVVAPATHDTGAAVAAVPTERTGSRNWAYISSGTWSLMGIESQTAIVGPEALAFNVTNEGGVDGTYRVLKNIMGLWLVQECRRSFEKRGLPSEYAELTELAAKAPPFQSLIHPDAKPFLAPSDMPTAIREFCSQTGQPVPESPGAIIRCCLESLAFRYAQVLAGLERLSGDRIDVVNIVGGGTQNKLLNQLTANACGRTVIAGPVEATALGNVLLQARAAGSIGTLADLRRVVGQSYPVERYEPQDGPAWSAAAERFRALDSAAGTFSA